jgi:HK97 family phage portal protein
MAGWLTRLFWKDTKQPEQRSTGYDRLLALSIGGTSSPGDGISESTALSVSAVYAAVDKISSSLASIPFNVFERQNDGGRRVAVDNDQYNLVHKMPSPYLTSFQFRKTLLTHVLLWGNGYIYLIRDKNTTRPIEYKIINPLDVSDIKMIDGELMYYIHDRGPVPFYDIIHITGLGTGVGPNEYFGKSPIRLHAETVGAARYRQIYGHASMKNGGMMSGLIKAPGALTPEQKQNLRQSFIDRHSGPQNAGSTAILEYGLEYMQLAMNPADVQLIETMKFGVEDIARIYGIPPHMIGHLEQSTNNNIEHQAIEYVQYCLMPWATAIEQAFDCRIFRVKEKEAGRYFVKLGLNALLRGDVQGRGEYYRLMLDRGIFSINEVRALEEMNAVEGGDIRLVQANMMTIENIKENKFNNGTTEN